MCIRDSMGADLISHFAALGSKCGELDATERLRILHDFYRQGEESEFVFNAREMMKPVSYTHLDVYKRQVLDDPAQQEQIRTEIAALTAQVKELRREVKLCGDIALRSVSIKDKIRAAREEQQAGKTEKGRLEPERAGRPTERR